MKILKIILSLIFALWLVTFLLVRFESHEYAPVSDEQRAAAQAYLAGKLTPAPRTWQWIDFEPSKGIKLRGGVIRHPQAKGTVMVIPGFTGSIEMIMREIVQIHESGYSVAAVEYRGQGKSHRPLANPEKGYVEDYALLASEILAFANSVRGEDQPLFFYSISKGAHITMRMAAEFEPDVRAYALMVPMIKINTADFDYERVKVMAKVLNTLGLGSMYNIGSGGYSPEVYGVATDCNGNPDTAQSQGALFALNPALRTRGTTVKWLYETINSSELLLNPDYAAKIKAPVLLFTAGVDHLVDTRAAQRFCSSLPNCEVAHQPESKHCITRENFALYDSLVDQVIAHFDAHL